ncbi:hypothetical protein NPX13_g2 [Xylaria arbuscula]|uniref:Uncharacterized protein n=1 Tax=Xylaria arbuscula TaxID=114810 RepID=A0A9W8NNM5_9PEZI|nr:hypothetical protein NPX13_g2 [Xylaria arbuscula]
MSCKGTFMSEGVMQAEGSNLHGVAIQQGQLPMTEANGLANPGPQPSHEVHEGLSAKDHILTPPEINTLLRVVTSLGADMEILVSRDVPVDLQAGDQSQPSYEEIAHKYKYKTVLDFQEVLQDLESMATEIQNAIFLKNIMDGQGEPQGLSLPPEYHQLQQRYALVSQFELQPLLELAGLVINDLRVFIDHKVSPPPLTYERVQQNPWGPISWSEYAGLLEEFEYSGDEIRTALGTSEDGDVYMSGV